MRLSVDVSFDPLHGYVGTAHHRAGPVRAIAFVLAHVADLPEDQVGAVAPSSVSSIRPDKADDLFVVVVAVWVIGLQHEQVRLPVRREVWDDLCRRDADPLAFEHGVPAYASRRPAPP